ncbi:MAG: hypothetical protein ACI4EG_10640 [Fusicatenibacter sp.]
MKRKSKTWILILSLVLAVPGITSCQKQEEDIPITTISQSTEDEDPEDNLEEELGDEIPEYDVELPEELGSFELAIWGELYTIPESYEHFVNKGWVYQGDEERQINPESYSEDEVFEMDGNTITVDVMNPDTTKKAVWECMIGGIHIDTNTAGGQSIYVNLPGGIVMQESLAEEVEDAYGLPKDRYETENCLQLTYEFGLYQTVTLGFDTDTETLVTLDMQNFRTKAGEEELENVSDAVTPEVEAYAAPETDSETINDFIVRYDGVLYRLPTPVSQLIEHGWTVNETESDRAVRNGKYGYVTLEKDGQKLYATVHNYGQEPTTVRNCFVTALYGDLDTTKVPIVITGGITLGTREEEFRNIVGDAKYEKKEDADNKVTYYTFYTDEKQLDYTQVSIDDALHLVRSIRVVHNQEEIGSPIDESGEDAKKEKDTENQTLGEVKAESEGEAKTESETEP